MGPGSALPGPEAMTVQDLDPRAIPRSWPGWSAPMTTAEWLIQTTASAVAVPDWAAEKWQESREAEGPKRRRARLGIV